MFTIIKGDCIQKKSYHLCMPNMAYIQDQEYDEDGKSISETNDLGYKQTIQYLNHTPVSVTTPGGNVLYMNINDTATSISTDVDGVENYNTCIYQDGRLTEYQAEGMTYRYTYDEFGREKEIFINDELYCSFIRTKTTTMISYKTLYKDHNGYEKITDVYDRVLKINRIKNDRILPYIVYEYDTKDRIVKETHYKDQQEETLEYLYIEDTLVGIRNTQYTKTSAVDIFGNLIEERYQTQDTTYQYTYFYDEENRLNGRSYSVNDDHILSEQYSYDSLNRIKEIENPILKNKFTYLSKNGRTTNLISTQQKQIGSHHQNNSYTYDKEGNIIRKLENHQITSYTYDSLHRLIREDNEALNQTIFYRYDSNGNIQSKEIYDYTQSEHLENKRNIQYNYSDFNDYLTQVNGREIKYDSIGNPILYKDMILEWDHKELKQYGDIYYTYDTNHIRTQKKTKDKTIEYILDGTRILKEIHTYYPTQLESYIDKYSTIDTYREEIEYIYGQEGIIGFDHIKGNERKRYLYNKNILGDILEIYDEEKNLVGKYSYDGYGNQKIEVNIHNIANINPIRYRSYYYDSETGLYLVTTRYYNPEWCRFISPDSIEYLDPSSINGMNLYAYCNDDPVNKIDPTGHFAISLTLLGLIIGAVVGATVGGVVAYDIAKKSGAEGWELAGWTLLGVVGGGIVGGALGAGAGALATKATGIVGLSITKYSILPIKSVTVLGHMPGYIAAATATGSGYYLISDGLWESLDATQRWLNNMQYIKDANALGSQFALVPDFVVRTNGTLWQEIQYLIEHGIPWTLF
ncbi:hypothetical protein HDR67_00185 [bacterium]|nr:hypothetical protein [bacterium]